MNLADFLKLVTGIKTACTHAGIDAKSARVKFYSPNDKLMDIEINGEGAHGKVTLHFYID
jgi:hypothetical protein